MNLRLTLLFLTALASTVPALADRPAPTRDGVSLPHVPGQVVLRTRPGRSVPIDGMRLVRNLDENTTLCVVDEPEKLGATLQRLIADPRVVFAEPNYRYRKLILPNDPEIGSQWAVRNTTRPGADLNLDDAWDIRSNAGSVTLAIIDDALETGHIDLQDNTSAVERCFDSGNGYCQSSTDASPTPGSNDQDHGTLVAGAAGAVGNNGLGLAGAAWEINLLALKIDLTTAAIAQAISFAVTQGADVINISLGGDFPSQAVNSAIESAGDAGVLVVTSAGNFDSNNDKGSLHFPSNYTAENLIAVAASDRDDEIASFSQFGLRSVDLAAPGSGIITTGLNNDINTFVSGTSFSAPLVAGVAALVRAETGASGPDADRVLRAHLLNAGVDGVAPGAGSTNFNAIPGRVATGRLDARLALEGPTGGVILLTDVSIDDGVSGNGELDIGETAELVLTLRNIWTTETDLSARLTTANPDRIAIAGSSEQTIGALPEGATTTVRFAVTLLRPDCLLNCNESSLFTLALNTPAGTLVRRHFYVETGPLPNGITVAQDAQRYDWDEFQTFHIDVPAGSENLLLEATSIRDIDLLARANDRPEYLISLGQDPESDDLVFVVGSDTEVSASNGGQEQLLIDNPASGTWYATVVNFDQTADQYTVRATVDASIIEFSGDVFAASEDAGSAVVSVARSGSISSPATVDYSVGSNSALAGIDFTAASGTLEWAAGDGELKTFMVPLIEDSDVEGTESAVLRLSSPIGGILGNRDLATLQINDAGGSSGGGDGGGSAPPSGGGGGGGSGGPIMLLGLISLLRWRTRASKRAARNAG